LRLFDNKKGEKILKIIYQCEPEGIRNRKLWQRSGLSRDGYNIWIKRLTDLELIYRDLLTRRKLLIHISDKTKDKLRNGIPISFLIPVDDRAKPIRRDRKRGESKTKERSKIQFLILSRAAFDNNLQFKRAVKPMAGDFPTYDYEREKEIWYTPDKHLCGFAVNDFVKKRRMIVVHQSPNDILNFTNSELLGYVFSKKDVRGNTMEFIKHTPAIISKVESSRHFDKGRFIISDSLLKSFVQKCVTILGPIEQFLSELYVYHKKILKNKAKEFKKWFVELYGTSNRTRSYFDYLSKRRKRRLGQDFNITKQLGSTVKYYVSELLDDQFREINPRYSRLIADYGSVFDIEKMMELIIPRFVREILRSWTYHFQK